MGRVRFALFDAFHIHLVQSAAAERSTLRSSKPVVSGEINCQKGLETMKVLLIKDVYKLGRAGDVKKVADGYGRNFLIRQGFAVLATEGAMKQIEKIRRQAEIRRTAQNEELKDIAALINGVTLTFPVKAGETGKLYGSITTQDVAAALTEQTRYEVKRQQVDMQPIRALGEFTAHVRLTMDLVPEIKIIVHREGESAESVKETGAQAEEKAEKPKRGGRKPKAEAKAAEPVEQAQTE
jgi:large subunit ribosomal protein L9